MTATLCRRAFARHGCKLLLTVLLLPVALCAAPTGAADLVYVGMHGDEIRALRLEPTTGTLTPIGPVARGLRPTWAVAHPRLPVLYAVDDQKDREGSVTAFAVDRSSGALTRLNSVASGGAGTTHLALDASAGTLLAANFGSGSVSSIGVNPNGSLGTLVSTLQATGSGPHRRQAGPHAHGSVVDPSGRYALVADFGADRVFVHRLDAARALSADERRAFALPPGSGPRHLAFGKDGRFVYVLAELTSEIVVLRWNAADGTLARVQSLSTCSAALAGQKSGAELAVSADGRFLYAADRGEHALVVYRVDGETGELAFLQRVPSGGEVPWHFALHPSGRWLLVANQRSNRVNVFAVDPSTGRLAETGRWVETPAPVSIAFVSGQ